MRMILTTLVLFGALSCATSETSSKAAATTAAAPTTEASAPSGTSCFGDKDEGCPTGQHCVKPPNRTEGVCSTLPSGAECTTSADCMSGSYCFKHTSGAGVCFRP